MSVVAGRVSIVVTSYNYARFLETTIDSALKQEWPDIEVIVVDDGSTDDSRAVIEGYGDRVTPLFQQNQGQSAAISAGFELVTGEVVIFLDSDDVLLPDLVGRIMPVFKADPAVAWVHWPMQVIDGQGQRLDRTLPPAGYELAAGDLAPHVVKFRNFLWNPTSASAYRTEKMPPVFPIPTGDYERGAGAPDLYLSETVVFLGLVRALTAVGTLYRVHGENESVNLRRGDIGEHARRKIGEVIVGHRHAREVAAKVGSAVVVPADPRKAWDWAFYAFRLTSVRADADQHPIAGDNRFVLALRGAWSIARHPDVPAEVLG